MLEALGGPRDVHVGRQMRREAGEQRAERVLGTTIARRAAPASAAARSG